jgi:hypothetical protein
MDFSITCKSNRFPGMFGVRNGNDKERFSNNTWLALVFKFIPCPSLMKISTQASAVKSIFIPMHQSLNFRMM